MSITLRLGILFVALSMFVVIVTLLKRGRVPFKYSLLWFVAVLVLLITAIVPSFFIFFQQLLDFKTMANMVVGIFIIILIFISVSLTIIVSGQSTKIQLLIQEVSLLKKQVDDNNRAVSTKRKDDE